MTSRLIYEAALVELNKVNVPSLLLEDYNYFINKAISLYINRSYNQYDINQQTSDSLRVLKATAFLAPTQTSVSVYGADDESSISNYSNIYEVNLPIDYYHILNCLVTYTVQGTFKCYDKGDTVEFGATRLTSDMTPSVINNAYMKPSYKRPYYFIHNVDSASSNQITNPYKTSSSSSLGEGTDPTVTVSEGKFNLNGLSRQVHTETDSTLEDLVEHIPGLRYGNASTVRMEIRYGNDNSIFKPTMVRIDYLKTPQYVRLTQQLLETTADTSLIMEFPDYVCQEIINGLVYLLMENASDQRLLTNPTVNTTVATPSQGLSQTK